MRQRILQSKYNLLYGKKCTKSCKTQIWAVAKGTPPDMVLLRPRRPLAAEEWLLCRHNPVDINLCHNLQKLRFLFIFLEISTALRYSSITPRWTGGSNNFVLIIPRCLLPGFEAAFGSGRTGGGRAALIGKDPAAVSFCFLCFLQPRRTAMRLFLFGVSRLARV